MPDLEEILATAVDATVLGPNDKLLVQLRGHCTPEQANQLAARFAEAIGPNRTLIVGGVEKLLVVRG